jgi:hypothetical protein
VKWNHREESAQDAGRRLAFEDSLGTVVLFVLALGMMNWFGWLLGLFDLALLLDVVVIGLAGFAALVAAWCFSNAVLDRWFDAHGLEWLSKREER